ncbi:hypothetical protein ACUXDP_003303 [Pantoea piersonii]|jgi:hypothetical protein
MQIESWFTQASSFKIQPMMFFSAGLFVFMLI